MRKILAYVMIGILITVPVYALNDIKTAAVSATVTTVFSASVSLNTVEFGNVQPGDWKELKTAGGNYHNEIVCKSNNGQTWYLKVKVDHALTAGANTIPVGNFQWNCGWFGSKNGAGGQQGTGVFNHSTTAWVPYTTTNDLVYTCGTNEKSNLPNGNGGTFSYALQVPNDQPIGTYTATITYTMTETL